MFKTNNFFLGVVAGVVFPAISWLTFHVWYSNLVLLGKPVIPYFTAIFINLLLLRAFHGKGADKTTQGIMLCTFVFLIFILLINKV